MKQYWFVSTQSKFSARLALFTFALAFVVIMLGAFTRLTDAGLSCPDWPNCYGYITAPHTPTQLQAAAQQYPNATINVKKAWTEMTHRYFAGTEGILILVLSLSLLFKRRSKDIKSVIIAMSLLALLCVQVTLGMLTVTEKLRPVIVLSHLLTGISILSVLWWAYLELRSPSQNPLNRQAMRFSNWFWLAFIVIIAQITLGGWVSTHYATLACVDFPYCNGKLLPAMQWDNLNGDLITIHMLHRLGALVTALYFGLLGLFLLNTTALRTTGIVLLTLLGVQVTLGILNIVWLRPVWIAVLHQSVAILLLLTVIALLVRVSMNRENFYGSRLS